MECPLCEYHDTNFLLKADFREYWLCPKCFIIFVPPQFFIPKKEEIRRYLEHDNNLESEGYVKMFQQKINLIKKTCPEVSTILDYGCGYEPVLKVLLEREGYQVDGYDINFFQLLDEDFSTNINTLREQYGINPEGIVFEITESADIEHFNLISTVLMALKAQGYRFSLDDFGCNLLPGLQHVFGKAFRVFTNEADIIGCIDRRGCLGAGHKGDIGCLANWGEGPVAIGLRINFLFGQDIVGKHRAVFIRRLDNDG
mgnify:CR=1 FL=1